MKTRSIVLFVISGLFFSVPIIADDTSENIQVTTLPVANITSGEELYKKSCKNCHGPTAKGMASFPKLVGSSPDHLAKRLLQYRSGEKVGPNTPLMSPQAAKLSDSDIADLVGYLSSLND